MPDPSASAHSDHCDVVVVGGGLAGLIAAERLAAQGVDCLVLEAGPNEKRRLPRQDARAFRRAIDPLLAVDGSDWAYETPGLDFDWIRVRAAGGRSLLWGGWSVRPDAQCLRDARAFGRPWPFALDDLTTLFQRAERLLSVQRTLLDESFVRAGEALGLPVIPKRASAGACGCRALVATDWLRRARLAPSRVATRVLLDGGAARGVEYIDPVTRRRGTVRARAVVLAASPIETARLLLGSDLAAHTDAAAHVGRGLVDHLVASYLVLLPRPAADPTPAGPLRRAAFVPRFVNLGRRARRDYRGGFTLELHGPESAADLPREGLDALGLDPQTAPDHAYYLVHAMGEVPHDARRRVEIDAARTDGLGRPRPLVHLAWDDEQPRMVRDMEESCVAFADALAEPGSRIFPIRHTLKPGGVAHEAGTCAMGRSARTSVADLTGRVHGLRGLYIADGSLLPSALDCPPTLTVLALALNTADGVLDAAARGDC